MMDTWNLLSALCVLATLLGTSVSASRLVSQNLGPLSENVAKESRRVKRQFGPDDPGSRATETPAPTSHSQPPTPPESTVAGATSAATIMSSTVMPSTDTSTSNVNETTTTSLVTTTSGGNSLKIAIAPTCSVLALAGVVTAKLLN